MRIRLPMPRDHCQVFPGIRFRFAPNGVTLAEGCDITGTRDIAPPRYGEPRTARSRRDRGPWWSPGVSDMRVRWTAEELSRGGDLFLYEC